jgi:hypothetical protein
MHAVVVRVNIVDPENAPQELEEKIVPRAKQAPGFVAGYWTRAENGNNGLSMVVLESEENARTLADLIESQGPLTDAVTLDSVEVREVVANA